MSIDDVDSVAVEAVTLGLELSLKPLDDHKTIFEADVIYDESYGALAAILPSHENGIVVCEMLEPLKKKEARFTHVGDVVTRLVERSLRWIQVGLLAHVNWAVQVRSLVPGKGTF